MQETVLVIGAGPSGLFATAELARHGVSARLVERDPVPHHEARAASVRPGTLEILESVGLARPLLDAAVAIRNVQLCGPDLVQFGQSNYVGIDCAYDVLASIPQYETERLITQRRGVLDDGDVPAGVL